MLELQRNVIFGQFVETGSFIHRMDARVKIAATSALSAMSPFMPLHGRGNLAPWTVPGTPAEQTQTTDIYRWWATLHHAMVPFWYSLAEEAYANDPEDPADVIAYSESDPRLVASAVVDDHDPEHPGRRFLDGC